MTCPPRGPPCPWARLFPTRKSPSPGLTTSGFPLCVGDIRVRGQALMLSAARDGDFTPLAELHTGDRGRMDLDGQLWCLGRRDRQIKIRGIRVEPATLERALIQIPGITDAAALVRQTGSRHRLWAFITGANAPSQDAIKAILQNSLADVLIPEHILTLPSLPVTSQGKTDYRALAHLADSAPASAAVSPLNSDHERLVAQLFSDVLQRHPIGPDDNFFDLGGDSISSLQVISRARRAGLDLSAKTIFEHQTVRAIARNAVPASSSSDDADAIGPVWSTPILSWLKGEMHGNWRQFNQAVVIALPDPVDLPRLQQALQAVVACHEIFGLQVSQSEKGAIDYHIAAMRPAPLFKIETRPDGMDDITWTGQRQTRLAQAQQHLDPERGINVAAVVLPSDRQMMLTVHHLCIDVLSWQVVLRDLQNAYEHPNDLPLRRHGIPWRRWALALQAFSRDPEVTASLPFWVDHLSPQPTPLAPDLPAQPGLERDARTCQLTLPANLTQHLLRKVPAVWTLRMDETLLAALALAHAAGHGRILRVDLERNGRALPIDTLDISETVGWFTSVIPLCLPVNPDARTMAQTITTALAALPHDGLGYGLLRYGDDPDQARRLAALPGADILVNYVGVLDGWTDGPFQPVDADTGPTIAPDLDRSHRLELNAGVVAGQLRLALNFAAGPNSEAAAQGLMHAIASALENIAVETGFDATAAIGADDFASASRVPVTPLQRGILLHSLHNPQTYFNQIHFKLEGPLDPEALQTAWAIMLDRHAALRCTFDFDDNDEPYQSIAPSASLTWQVSDWSALDDQRADPHLRALMQADRQQGFALGQAPLMRMHLIRRSHDRHDWVWSSHHLIMDGWSVSVLMQELLDILKALGNDTTPNLPAAPDWSAFVRRWNALDANAARRWWQHALADASPTLMALPSAETPQSAPQYSATRALDPVVRDGLSALCRRHGVPLGVALQASWALLLRRYRSTGTVVFGITFAHRPADFDHADALVGMTINTVPVSATLTADMTLATLLGNLRQHAFERADHAFIGLDDILQSTGHDPANPLFDTLLLVQNYPRPSDLVANGLTLKVATLHEETNFALTAIVTTGDDAALAPALGPDADRRQDRHRCAGTLVPAAVCHGSSTHGQGTRSVPLYRSRTGTTGRPGLRAGQWLARPSGPGLFQRVGARAARTSGDPGQRGEFQLRGTEAGRRHAVPDPARKGCRTRRTRRPAAAARSRAVTALLAVMQAGAMAVPIDAAYPAERIAWILGDSNARWLLTDTALTGQVPASCAARILPIDQMPHTAAAGAVRGPDLNAADPAYLIYTSGSTGQPKGAMTPHGGLASMIRLQRHHLAPEVTDRVLQFAALSFDASIWEIFMALGSGATLHIPDPDTVRFGEELLDTLENDRITIATLPPSLLVALPTRTLPSLRLLMVAGEACPDAVVEKWASGRRFFNGYGPSEASVCSNLYEARENARRIPIGKPGAHCRAYVMDLDGHLVPPEARVNWSSAETVSAWAT
ncbi:condensation domain-containing protein [Neopusillimonas aromaticivorans]|uniref:condensation domain-containing protein n=1 Tax=Neopusillimonas aromaticivorans TaxID=2979868 RepID=UPI002592A92D|nr:condensation domain-containing protein [Neopusillimonas aromaticivorans]WJJ92655.1 condensation domain-containing protein [Neopusillimonas aromaticivorans]